MLLHCVASHCIALRCVVLHCIASPAEPNANNRLNPAFRFARFPTRRWQTRDESTASSLLRRCHTAARQWEPPRWSETRTGSRCARNNTLPPPACAIARRVRPTLFSPSSAAPGGLQGQRVGHWAWWDHRIRPGRRRPGAGIPSHGGENGQPCLWRRRPPLRDRRRPGPPHEGSAAFLLRKGPRRVRRRFPTERPVPHRQKTATAAPLSLPASPSAAGR